MIEKSLPCLMRDLDPWRLFELYSIIVYLWRPLLNLDLFDLRGIGLPLL